VKPHFWSLLACALSASIPILQAGAAERVIDDEAYVEAFVRASDQLAESWSFEAGDAGEESRMGGSFPPSGEAIVSSAENLYRDCLPAVVLVGSVYQCDKCSNWHHGGFAGGWIASQDGHVVTNHHVLNSKRKGRLGIMTSDGTVYPVKSVSAWNEAADIAVLQIELFGRTLPFLKLADDVYTGEAISIISHPDGRLWYLTRGFVARFSRKDSKEDSPAWMNVTADYAVGSSGAPVLNEGGAVVGMVSSTTTIYTGPKAARKGEKQSPMGDPQMIVKECVPLSELRRVLIGR
jgi:S1-C subfamily serine protease